jgi:hypothetical protein
MYVFKEYNFKIDGNYRVFTVKLEGEMLEVAKQFVGVNFTLPFLDGEKLQKIKYQIKHNEQTGNYLLTFNLHKWTTSLKKIEAILNTIGEILTKKGA